MQQIRKCLGVDIGGTSVKIAEVALEKNGARVTKLVSKDLGLLPGPMDKERINAILQAIRSLIKDNKISTKHTVFCLPGQTVFIRQLSGVPRTTEERLRNIIKYEARQLIPFALDNSVIEYQVFDYGDSAELKVLLAAVKKDIVADFMKVVAKTGLTPVMISVSSLALMNFHVFDATPYIDADAGREAKAAAHADKEAAGKAEAQSGKKKGFGFQMPKLSLAFGKKKTGGEEEAEESAAPGAAGEEEPAEQVLAEEPYEEVRAFVNAGAQTFDLVIARFGKHKMIGFPRSVPMAGNELTKSLHDKMGLGSFQEAEELKRSGTMVIMPGGEQEVNEKGGDLQASELATAWADHFVLDLRKSFDYYISQPDGMAVDTISLSGGQSHLPNLAAYVEDRLGIPTETKNDTQNTALMTERSEGAEKFSSYLIAMGLALSGVGLGKVSIDFLPADIKTLREFKKKNVEMFLLAGAIGGMIVMGYLSGMPTISRMTGWLNTHGKDLERISQNRQQLQEAKQGREATNTNVTALAKGIGDRSYWLEFLGVVESVKPPEVFVTRVSLGGDGHAEIDAESDNKGAISMFAEELEKQKDWIAGKTSISAPVLKNSIFLKKPVDGFRITAKTIGKKTRLAPARVPLLPGQLTPTPSPTPQPGGGFGPGMMMPGMGPGGPNTF
ncbi:MAG: pilus assembly protein PilM [bacterium]